MIVYGHVQLKVIVQLVLSSLLGLDQGKGKSSDDSEVGVEMQRCGACEVIQLSQQRATIKDNPAYQLMYTSIVTYPHVIVNSM